MVYIIFTVESSRTEQRGLSMPCRHLVT